MAKDTFYFSHDYNTRNDIKIKKLISKHGYLGFGIFWAIVEDLYNNANALPTDYDCIAYELRTTEEVIKSIILDFELFVVKDGFFGSISIENRINERNAKSIKARESANLRWNKNKADANALPTQSECNAIKERKEKERKEKESKVNKTKEEKIFTPPTVSEVEEYFFENGYSKESGNRAFQYYNVSNWIDSKNNQVKNWKQKMLSVWFKEENKIKPIISGSNKITMASPIL